MEGERELALACGEEYKWFLERNNLIDSYDTLKRFKDAWYAGVAWQKMKYVRTGKA